MGRGILHSESLYNSNRKHPVRLPLRPYRRLEEVPRPAPCPDHPQVVAKGRVILVDRLRFPAAGQFATTASGRI